MSCASGQFTKECDLPSIMRKDDIVIPLQFKDEDGDTLDVSGDTLYITFKSDDSLDDSEAEMQYQMTIGNTSLTQAGEVDIPISSFLTSIPVGSYHYDIQWRRVASGANETHTPYVGNVTIKQDITIS